MCNTSLGSGLSLGESDAVENWTYLCGPEQGVQLLLDGVSNFLPCPLEVSNHALDQNKNEEKVLQCLLLVLLSILTSDLSCLVHSLANVIKI